MYQCLLEWSAVIFEQREGFPLSSGEKLTFRFFSPDLNPVFVNGNLWNVWEC